LQDTFSLLRQLLENLTNDVSYFQSTSGNPTTTTTTSTPPGQNSVENVGVYLSQAENAFNQLQPSISRLFTLLQQESSLYELQLREEANSLSSSLSPLLQQLGLSLLLISSSLGSLQMGAAPSHATVHAPLINSSFGLQNLGPSGPVSLSLPVMTISRRSQDRAPMETTASRSPAPMSLNNVLSSVILLSIKFWLV
jgi:hypothetical protein